MRRILVAVAIDPRIKNQIIELGELFGLSNSEIIRQGITTELVRLRKLKGRRKNA